MRIFLCLFICLLLGAGTTTFAESNESPIAGCEKEFFLTYFPEDFVKEVLEQQGIPEEKWAPIVNALSEKDEEIVKKVEEKARSMDASPLRDPNQRSAAVRIFRETLFEVFDEVMHENGITDTAQVQFMLDEIQRKKATHFIECIRNYHQPEPYNDTLIEGEEIVEEETVVNEEFVEEEKNVNEEFVDEEFVEEEKNVNEEFVEEEKNVNKEFVEDENFFDEETIDQEWSFSFKTS